MPPKKKSKWPKKKISRWTTTTIRWLDSTAPWATTLRNPQLDGVRITNSMLKDVMGYQVSNRGICNSELRAYLTCVQAGGLKDPCWGSFLRLQRCTNARPKDETHWFSLAPRLHEYLRQVLCQDYGSIAETRMYFDQYYANDLAPPSEVHGREPRMTKAGHGSSALQWSRLIRSSFSADGFLRDPMYDLGNPDKARFPLW